MSHRENHPGSPLSTLTHARVRAMQGDVRTARSILACILRQDPGHVEAKKLQERLSHRDQVPSARGWEERLHAAEPDDPSTLTREFKRVLRGTGFRPREKAVEHLKWWLDRIKGNSGGTHA